MFFENRNKDIDGKYLSFFVDSVSKLFETEDTSSLILSAQKELGFELLCLVQLHEEKLTIKESSHQILKGKISKNPFLLRAIEEREELSASSLFELLAGFIDNTSLEDLQYSRRIKYNYCISFNDYALIIGTTIDIPESIKKVLKTMLEIIVEFDNKVLKALQKDYQLEKEIKVLRELQTFTNFSIFKNDFTDIAQFAVDQIAKDLNFPAVLIITNEDSVWKLLAITRSKLTSSIEEKLGRKYTDMSVDSKSGNKALLAASQHETFKTAVLSDVLTPPLDNKTVELIKSIAGIKLSYIAPIEYHSQILGNIIFLTRNDDLDAFDEHMLDLYAKQLGVIMANAQNLQEIKRSKDMLNEAYKDLETLNKEKDNLMSIVSHELRTPATIARDAISLIYEYHVEVPENIKDKLRMIKEAAERQLNIINEILEVSRINTKKIELVYQQVQIEELINTAYEEMKLEADKKGLALSYEKKDSPLPEIKVDSTRIREVIDNLITNAIKYTENGSITIKTSLDNKYIQISISDTGRGISEDVQSTLFQMFHRISDNIPPLTQEQSHQGGLGLGLYIVKNIIESHNGTISVKSELGKGTTFFVNLPI